MKNMDKTENKKVGNAGEQAAAEYLEKNGYKILERNLRLFCGEIDVLAECRKTLVIVEVKTVRGEGFGPAFELVRFKKQGKLRTLARALEQEYPDRDIRIDVIGVEFSYGQPRIEHIENAVEG